MGKEPPTLLLLAEARNLRRQGRLKDAEDALRRGLKAHPGDNRLRTALADVLFRLGRTAEARGFVEPVLEDGAPDAPALLLMGDIQLKEEKPARALEFFQEARRLQETPSVLTRLARAHLDLKDVPRAEECLHLALQKDPDDAFTLRLLARCRRGRGDRTGAVNILEGILKRSPEDRFTYSEYIRARTDGMSAESRLSELKGILKVSSRRDNNFLHAQLGDTLRELGRYGEALEAYEKALSLKPGDPFLLRQLGFCLNHMGRYDRVVELFRGPFLENPRDVYVRSTLLSAYRKLKDTAGLHALLDEALRRHPDARSLLGLKRKARKSESAGVEG